jgi:hypothetical protein
MRLSLSEPGLGPFWDLGFSAVAEEAQVTVCKHAQRLLMLWRALVTLPAVSEAAPLGRMCGHLQRLLCMSKHARRYMWVLSFEIRHSQAEDSKAHTTGSPSRWTAHHEPTMRGPTQVCRRRAAQCQ